MKEEFYEYICPSKRMTKKRAEANKITTKSEDLVWYASIFFILLVFSLPMAISKVWLWIPVFVLYIVFLLVCKFDKDPYSEIMLFLGSTTLYLCIVLSFLIISESYKRFQISSIFPLSILTIFCVVFYEFTVFVNLLLKRHATRKATRKSYPKTYTTIGTFCGGVIGALLARHISPHLEDSLWSVWFGLIACSLLFTLSFSFFQKYILYKILHRRIDTIRQQEFN